MNKFSEGEWKRTGLVVTVCDKGIIAKCPTPQAGGVFECADNAKLIAAAPKLLKACEIAVLAMTHEPINPDDIKFIQAAIVAAEEIE